MRQELLDILVCPETRQPVYLADAPLLDRLNRRIGQGRLANRGGTPITTPLEAALVREDRRYCYPIRADIPVMLIDEAIPLSDLC
ncbi:MAG: Trm112 family protein [Desulfurellaceae bacterium]|nr:Trm112 family protein [Desulfurellaceae bacterium]